MGLGGRSTRSAAALALLIGAVALLAFLPGTALAKQKTVWLCKPGLAKNPCEPSLKTTRVNNDGSTDGVFTPKTEKKPKIDCFYVYPTVSDDKSDNSDLSIDPEEKSIALYQAARYSQECRVFAPMYKQVTITRLLAGGTTQAMMDKAYNSALSGWNDYLKNYNDGRPFVLIGHSQGSFVLRKLIGQEIDKNKALRKQMVSAILLGGNVLVKQGEDVGGDFTKIPACASQSQLHCVVAWSTFNEPVPDNSLFGRTTVAGDQVLCAYPGSKDLQSIQPTKPFAPHSTLGQVVPLVGFPTPTAKTPWVEYDHAYKGSCSSAGGANVLQLTDQPGAPHLHPTPDSTWGLHLVDANIALGNLTAMVAKQTKAFFK